MEPPLVVIVGSINMDLVVRAAHVPAPGETVLGREFATIPGGKGANQAVAVARLGGKSSMIGRVGDDAFGPRLRQGLLESGVDVRHVQATRGHASGIAMIVVGDDGENAIAVASEANFEVTPADVDAAEPLLRQARVCLLQLELPLQTVLHTIEVCRRAGVETILDPAPAPADHAPPGLFEAGILTPNESEAALLTGLPPTAGVADIVRALQDRGAGTLVLKRGAEGAYFHSPEGSGHVHGFRVDVVDSTAAGDAFTAALAVGRARGWPMSQAVRFANAAGALACTRLGAQPSLPTAKETESLIQRSPEWRSP